MQENRKNEIDNCQGYVSALVRLLVGLLAGLLTMYAMLCNSNLLVIGIWALIHEFLSPSITLQEGSFVCTVLCYV